MYEFKKVEGLVKRKPAVGIAGAVLLVLLILYLKNRQSAATASVTPATTAAATNGVPAPVVTYFAPATSGGYGDSVHQTPTPILPTLPIPSIPIAAPPPSMPTLSPIGPVFGAPIAQPAPGTLPGVSAANPLIPFNFFSSHQFPTIPGNPRANVKTFGYNGTTYTVQPGPSGKVYGTPVGGSGQVLLYGPASMYH